MRNLHNTYVFGILALALLTGISIAEDLKTQKKVNPYTSTQLGISDFGFKLFQALKKDNKEPVAISPLSIAEALILTANGSDPDSETRKEFENLFLNFELTHAGAGVGSLTTGIADLRDRLTKYSAKSKGTFEFSSVNSLWGNTNPLIGFKFNDNFTKIATAKDTFNASLNLRNFQTLAEDGESKQALLDINAWVKNATNQKIPSLLTELKDEAVAVVLNAIYAKGLFERNFNHLTEGEYRRQDADKAEIVTYMNKNDDMNYYEDELLQAVSFEVGPQRLWGDKNPPEIVLDILVPKKGDISELAEHLDGPYYRKIADALKKETPYVELTVPAGKVAPQNASKLKNILVDAFYVSRMFDDEHAEFSALGSTHKDENLYIDDVVTKTVYDLGPLGFEAAASTAVSVAVPTSGPAKIVKLNVNRSALHIVRHAPTGTPLFIVEFDTPQRYSQDEIVKLVKRAKKANRWLYATLDEGTIDWVYDKEIVALFTYDEQYNITIKKNFGGLND